MLIWVHAEQIWVHAEKIRVHAGITKGKSGEIRVHAGIMKNILKKIDPTESF